MLEKITRHLYPEKLNGKKYKAGGMKVKYAKHVKPYDHKYAQLGGIFGTNYQPKGMAQELDTVDVKDQNGYNTCSWNAYTVMRQVSEKVVLSPRTIITYARLRNLLSDTGLSNLDNNSRAGTDFGVAEEKFLPNDLQNGNWEAYTSPSLLTLDVRNNAAIHRPDSHKKFFVTSKAEYLKALDDGYAIEIGIPWYSGYNMSGGFTFPWLIKWSNGTYVGGHAITIKFYKDLVMQNGIIVDATLKIQNSYSKNWGDNGCFYMKLSDLVNNGIVGMVEVDLNDQNIPVLIKQYEGQQVKGVGPAIFFIQNGCKRPFNSPEIFFVFGGRFGRYGKTYMDINQSTLDAIPLGSPMNVEDSPFWPALSSNGITKEFIAANQNMLNIWIDNPKTLQMIVATMQRLNMNVQSVPQTWLDKITNLFN